MTLYALFLFAGLNHAAKSGASVAVLLAALYLQAPPVVVGTLTALSALLPMLFAVSIGRLNDRFGARLPLFAGAVLFVVSLLFPAVWPGLPALFATAALAGLGATAFAVSSQSVVGLFGRREDRNRNFSWLSIAFSSGGVVGPILAGGIIDRAGHSSAFIVLASLPVFAAVALASARLALPPPRALGAGDGAGGASRRGRRALDLLRDPGLRTVYLLTGLHVSAWEVFSFLVPVYGAGIGLAATSIGIILGSFAAATFFVRILVPLFAGRIPALRLIWLSLVLAGGLFVLFPLSQSVLVLAVLAFFLGMNLGVTQPLAMAVLHESAPAGRAGEAVGLRTAVVNLSVATTPVMYGALGSVFGMLPVFWGLAAALWVALWALR
ncbi:MAG: MFS transporter [Burkholderiales bacterium]|nr:MFS transporter [Burkholderiales bacterium]